MVAGEAEDQAIFADAGHERRLRPGGRRPALPGARGVLAGVAVIAAVAVVYCCALREASTVTPESDAASFALQGWAMAHGNPLLHGWRLADASFYTIDLPVYALGVLVVGLRPAVVPACAAAVFTSLVVLAALVARGRSRGLAGALAAALAAVIMAGPAVPVAGVLLAMPDHTGTALVPLALALVIDRARRGWRTAALVCGVLTWGLAADPLVLIIAVVPVVVVCLARAVHDRAARSEAARSEAARSEAARSEAARSEAARSELFIAAGGIGSVAGYLLVRVVIRAAGGWELDGTGHQFIQGRDLAGNLGGTLQDVLNLFSASPFGQPAGAGLLLTAVHLALFGLVVVAGWVALRRRPWTGDLVAVLLAAGIVANLAAYTLLYLTGPATGQDVAPAFGMGAALAGRVLGGPLASAWQNRATGDRATEDRATEDQAGRVPRAPVGAWRNRAPRAWPLLAALAAVVVAVAVPPLVTARPAAPDNAMLAAWLEAHGLHDGIAQYWQANSVMLDTGGAVAIRGVWDYGPDGGIRPYPWEEDTSLLDPRRNDARFVIAAAHSGLTRLAIESRFGPPARVFQVGTFTVLVYDRNLLPGLAGLPAPWPSPVGL
jgi:hypothetical protein